MHCLSARVGILMAAMTFPLTALGQPYVGLYTFSSPTSTERYKKTLVQAAMEYTIQPDGKCLQTSVGAWTVTSAPEYQQITFGTVEGPGTLGARCPGQTFTFAAVYFTWTNHNNKAAFSISDRLHDSFDVTWNSPNLTFPWASDISVKVVRPVSETTAFKGWDPDPIMGLTVGRWKQTLHPPADDPTFDFSGESVKEANPAGFTPPKCGAPGVKCPDTCWFPTSMFKPFIEITGGKWIVQAGNVWYFDYVGWLNPAVTWYRLPHGAVPARAPCVARFPQQMKIKAPSETSRNNYARINKLGGNIGLTTVTSKRAGSSKTKTWP